MRNTALKKKAENRKAMHLCRELSTTSEEAVNEYQRNHNESEGWVLRQAATNTNPAAKKRDTITQLGILPTSARESALSEKDTTESSTESRTGNAGIPCRYIKA